MVEKAWPGWGIEELRPAPQELRCLDIDSQAKLFNNNNIIIIFHNNGGRKGLNKPLISEGSLHWDILLVGEQWHQIYLYRVQFIPQHQRFTGEHQQTPFTIM